MSRSTRSNNSFEDGEEPQRQGEQAGVAEALPPQPRTSFLSLPDDLLLQIYEELYEDTYGTRYITSPVSEILINIRIFNLARPLWFSRLMISANQSDRRLSSVILDLARRKCIRELTLVFVPTFAHLTRAALSQLPLLTSIVIVFQEALLPKSEEVLLDTMVECETIKNFRLRYIGCPQNALERKCGDLAELRSGLVEVHEDRQKVLGLSVAAGLETVHLCNGFCGAIRWNKVVSLTLENRHGGIIGAREMLESLDRSLIQGEELGTPLPLKHLSLSLFHVDEDSSNATEHFGSANFTSLFRLLSRTSIDRIELNQVMRFPSVLDQHRVDSVKQLRITGTASFAKNDNFEKLSPLLRTFPSLIQLHLSGNDFFREEVSADDIAKLKGFEMSFRFPMLSTLLPYLKTTNVKIFTYKGENRAREIRWTRVSKEEDFDRDCWTLS